MFTCETIWSRTFAFLWIFFVLLTWFHYWQLVPSYFLFLLDSVLEDCMFWEFVQFFRSFIYQCIIIHFNHESLYFCSVSCTFSSFMSDFTYWTLSIFLDWESLGEQDQINQLKRNQPWVLFGRTDSEAPTLWPPDVNSWLIGKDPDAGKDWRQKGKKLTENEMVGWHHRLNGHALGQTLGDSEGQGSLESQGVTKSQTQLGDWTKNLFNKSGLSFFLSILSFQRPSSWFHWSFFFLYLFSF